MSRKRDTNWSRDEITVLLDSIIEITRTRANDGKRTNSREVFEYAAKKMGEKGHASRAEKEKCRTKWKKMKEEFTHAKRAREGDARCKEAPGIQPFFDRMEEFINGNFDNISPHSTIVRRTSSMSSGRPSSGGSGVASNSAGSSAGTSASSSNANDSIANAETTSANNNVGMRTSARIAASTTNGTSTSSPSASSNTSSTNSNNVIDNNNNGINQDTSNTIALTKPNSNADYSSNLHTPASLSPHQEHSRLSVSTATTANNTTNYNNSNTCGNNFAPSTISSPSASSTVATTAVIGGQQQQQQQHHHHRIHHYHHQNATPCSQPLLLPHQSMHKADMCIHSAAYNNINNNNNNNNNHKNNHYHHHNHSGPSCNNSSSSLSSYANHSDSMHVPSSHEHADISYRVSSGCRQITIFGDHDVDIKFRGDCITINKIDADYSSAETS